MLDLLGLIKGGNKTVKARARAGKLVSNIVTSKAQRDKVVAEYNCRRLLVTGCVHTDSKGLHKLDSTALLMACVYTPRQLGDMLRVTERAIYYLTNHKVYSTERRILLTYCRYSDYLIAGFSNANSASMARNVALDLMSVLMASIDLQKDEVEAHERNT